MRPAKFDPYFSADENLRDALRAMIFSEGTLVGIGANGTVLEVGCTALRLLSFMMIR